MASLLPLLALIARSAGKGRALAERYPHPAFALPTAPKWRHERPQTGFVTAGGRGAASDGGEYTLTSIEILINADIPSTNIGSLSVSLWSADSSGHPAISLHTLTNPASIAAGVAASFTAPAGATLQTGTIYVLVVHYHFGVAFPRLDIQHNHIHPNGDGAVGPGASSFHGHPSIALLNSPQRHDQRTPALTSGQNKNRAELRW